MRCDFRVTEVVSLLLFLVVCGTGDWLCKVFLLYWFCLGVKKSGHLLSAICLKLASHEDLEYLIMSLK